MAHYTYCSAPSKLNKKELYQEYIKLVEHSKKNDFLVSCTKPTRTQKQHIETQNDMIEKQKKMLKIYEEKDEISASVIKDYEEKVEYLENKIADLEKDNERLQEDLKKFKECAVKIREELSESSTEDEEDN
jgi:predicted nuclease with TOPRIM domain